MACGVSLALGHTEMATLGLELYMPDSKACVLNLPAAHLPRAELPGPVGLLPILPVGLLGLRLLSFVSL